MLHKLLISAVSALAITASAAADEMLSQSWDDIVSQAKQEGELNWFVWYFQPDFREHVKQFEAEYGISVSIADATDAKDGVNKLLAESGRDVGDIDVLAMGGEAMNNLDMQKLFYGPIKDVLPEGSALRTNINGGFGKDYGIAYWGNQTGIAYDSNRVELQNLPQDLAALEAWIEANPEQLGFNYEKGGSGPSFIHNVTRAILEVSPNSELIETPDLSISHAWFIQRRDQFIITASNADSLTRLNDGEFLIVPAWEDHLASLRNKNEVGSHILFYIPAFGMNGGGNAVAIPANAGNKAAALVFIHWLTSAENQVAFNQRFGTAPVNANADAAAALVSMEQRQSTRDWVGPLPIGDVMGPFIENVVEN